MKGRWNFLQPLILAVILGVISYSMSQANLPATIVALGWGVMIWFIFECLLDIAKMTRLASVFTEYTTYDIMVMAAMIALGGVFKAYWGQLRLIMESVFGPFGGSVIGGGFYFWAVLAIYLIRKPLVGSVTMVLGGVVEILAGNPFGLPVLLFDFWEGLGPDIVYGIFKLKKFNLVVAILAGLLAAYLGVFYGWFYFGFQYLGFGAFVLYLFAQGVGGVLGGVVGHYLGVALEKIGVRPPAKAVIENA
jgi:energy-coupling factor transport system permease protein